MRHFMAVTALALAACSQVPRTQPMTRGQPVAPAPPAAPAPPEQSSPGPAIAPAEDGLNDLSALTSGCPKAALNAAAREAAGAPTEGTYRFSYFHVISDSHHALYEVHFKSNYEAEPDLRYCVALYCQQGWDPKSAKVSISLIGAGRDGRRAGAAGPRAGAPAGANAGASAGAPAGASAGAHHAAAAGSATCSSGPTSLKPRVKR